MESRNAMGFPWDLSQITWLLKIPHESVKWNASVSPEWCPKKHHSLSISCLPVLIPMSMSHNWGRISPFLRRSGITFLVMYALSVYPIISHIYILVGGLEHFIFPYIGNNNPNLLKCLRGVETTNQYISHYIPFVD